MMQVGIFTGYFPYGLEETAQKIRALGFNTVQLDMHFRDVDVSAGQITKDKCIRIRETFRDHDLPVCCVSGYTNIVDSVEETLRMFAEVNHPGLGLLMDPTNYFEAHNIGQMDKTLNYVFDAL